MVVFGIKKTQVVDVQLLAVYSRDPLGINPKEADYYCYVLEARHLRAIYLLTFMSTSNCFIIFNRLQR